MRRVFSLFIRRNLIVAMIGLAVCALVGIWIDAFVYLAQLGLLTLAVLVCADAIMLLGKGMHISARREMPSHFSNGDENFVHINLENLSEATWAVTIIDELPMQFQMRDIEFSATLRPGMPSIVRYAVRPTRRGVYAFGALNVYVRTPLALLERRVVFESGANVSVYPSVINMRRTELLAFSQQSVRYGMRRLRRLGHTMEFEKIKQYVAGDDVRTMNWKATARTAVHMVNMYQDERSQDIYSVLDLGRVMKMPFEGLTLLDYSINAALAFSNVVLKKHDRAGLITFGLKSGGCIVPADVRAGQIALLNEALYGIQTGFAESDDEALFSAVRRTARQRSLLMIYTNMESLNGMRRRLPLLRLLARQHVVVVVVFENTELKTLIDDHPKRLDGIYMRTIAATFAMQKREIVAELRRHGIYAVLTPPKDLSLATVNIYLELKTRGVI